MATIHIQSGKSDSSCSRREVNIQNIPFKIHADCDANVNKYFNNYIKPDKNETLKASFRGYPLKGRKMNLPEEYVGIILHESIRPATEKDERKFYKVGQFSNITFWNWDKPPSRNDPITQALQWIDVAEALHSPVLEE